MLSILSKSHRILFVLHSHNDGGAERHLLTLMNGLRDTGHAVCFAGPSRGWLAEQMRALGHGHIPIEFHGLGDLWSLWRLVGAARQWRAEILHGHLTRAAHYVGWAGRITGLPNVASAHSTNAGKHFGRANAIVAASGAVNSFLLNEGYSAARLQTIYLGIEDPRTLSSASTPNTSAFDRSFSGEPAHMRFCMAARFVPDKGQDIAIEAMAALEDERVELLLAGNHQTDWGRHCQALSQRLGLENRVRFLGPLANPYELFSASAAVLGPSRREALSLSLIEACALARPIIASNVGGIPEVVSHQKNGLLVPAEDAKALATAMATVGNNPRLALAMGEAGRTLFLERFTASAMIKDMVSLYQRL